MKSIITNPTAITPQWLTAQLYQSGHLQQGQVIKVTAQPLTSHANSAVALTVTYSDETEPKPTTQLVCKLYAGDNFWAGWAEVIFYTELVTGMADFAAPRCYAAAADITSRTSHLLLEDLSTTHYVQVKSALTLTQYQQCVDELAKLHAHWWEHPDLSADKFMQPHGGPLRMAQAIAPEQIRRHGAWLQVQLPQILQKIGQQLTTEQRAFCEQAVLRWPDLLIELTKNDRQLTLIHGDYHHYGNIWLPYDSSGTIKILDWETWKRGIGVYDLAYLLVYEEEARRQWEHTLLERYHQQLIIRGIDYTWDQCLRDYRLSLLACLFPPLLWPNEAALHSALHACEDWGIQQWL